MKSGINKAELFQSFEKDFTKPLLEFVLEQRIAAGQLRKIEQYIALAKFVPSVPKSWQKRTENLLDKLETDGYKVLHLNNYFQAEGIPEHLINDLKRFLEEQELIVSLDGQYYWHGTVFKAAVEKLRANTGTEFIIPEAKEILGLSRKLMIPFLEKLDQLKRTNRVDNKRVWQKNSH
jgi:selenocysteine-specific elongation factor